MPSMKTKIISFSIQKGGSGKSTSAATIGAILAAEGQKVLLVDLDPQASLTQGLGIEAEGASIAEVLGGSKRGTLKLADIIQPIKENLDLAPSDIRLASSELGLVSRYGRENVLKQALAEQAELYDLIIIDSPPSLGILTINALAASDFVIIPSLPSPPDLRGVRLFLATLKDLQENGLNDNLKLLGILLVQFDGRTIAHKQALEDLKGEGLDVLGIIPKGIKVQESSGAQKLLIDYDPNGKPTAAYFEAAERIKQCLK